MKIRRNNMSKGTARKINTDDATINENKDNVVAVFSDVAINNGTFCIPKCVGICRGTDNNSLLLEDEETGESISIPKTVIRSIYRVDRRNF